MKQLQGIRNMRNAPAIFTIFFFLLVSTSCRAWAQDEVPGSLQLLEGYEHIKLQGIDSRVGKVQHEDGFEIMYEIGRVAQPGQPRMGGDFSDRAEALIRIHEPKGEVEWSTSLEVRGERANIVLLNNGTVVASFPETGANFSAQTETRAQFADVLTMVLTYPSGE